MLYKRCAGCGRLISQADALCADCLERGKRRHIVYNQTKRNAAAAAFYDSRAWSICREAVRARYKYLDIYDYYINQKITASEHVHHIVELEDDWSLRLAPDNLIPLSHSNHSRISTIYKRGGSDKAAAQALLRSLCQRWNAELGGEALPPGVVEKFES